MTLFEIVMKLNGPIQPTGDSRLDEQRLANLDGLDMFMEYVLHELRKAASHADRQEYSMKKIGERAREILEAIRNDDEQ